MRIGLLRESGGLGDVVMTGGAVRRLKDEGNEVIFIGFTEYSDAAMHIGYDQAYSMDANIRSRRRDRSDLIPVYNKDYDCFNWLGCDRVYDLFCPGYTHESISVRKMSDININRVEAFQIACGFVSNFKRQIWKISNDELKVAQRWIDYKGLRNDKLVCMHIRATDKARSYIRHKILYMKLKERGFHPLIVDSSPLKEYSDEDWVIWREPLWLKAAIMQLSKCFIGVDSGFLHIAAGLGIPILSLWGCTNAEQTTKLYETNTSLKVNNYNDSNHVGIPVADKDGIKCKPPCIHSPEICRRRTGCNYLNSIEPEVIIDKLENL